jgi:hypothetical protein
VSSGPDAEARLATAGQARARDHGPEWEHARAESCGGSRAAQSASFGHDALCSSGPISIRLEWRRVSACHRRTHDDVAPVDVPRAIRDERTNSRKSRKLAPRSEKPAIRKRRRLSLVSSVERKARHSIGRCRAEFRAAQRLVPAENGSLAAGRRKKAAPCHRTRAPRPSREERLSATKNRVRYPNGPLVNVRLTRTGFEDGQQRITRPRQSPGLSGRWLSERAPRRPFWPPELSARMR